MKRNLQIRIAPAHDPRYEVRSGRQALEVYAPVIQAVSVASRSNPPGRATHGSSTQQRTCIRSP